MKINDPLDGYYLCSGQLNGGSVKIAFYTTAWIVSTSKGKLIQAMSF